jgi:hypothetical protein
MKFTNANKLHRKSGGMGHPSFARNHGHGLTLQLAEKHLVSHW